MKRRRVDLSGGFFFLVFALANMAGQCFVVYDAMWPHFLIDKDSLLYVCSSGAQVVAAMYGLTLTGYVFYSDKMRKAVEQDESLRDIVDELQRHNYRLVLFISAMSLVAFIGSMLLLLYGSENHIVPVFWHRLILLETCLFTFQVVTFILFFVIRMLDPKTVERSGQRGKERISSEKSPEGNVQDFLRSYQEMEGQLRAVQRAGHTDHRHRVRPEEILAARLPETLFQNVVTVRKYHDYLIHSHKWTVTQAMCDLAAAVVKELQALDQTQNQSQDQDQHQHLHQHQHRL